MPTGLSFSWRRASGVSALSRRVSRATGVPLSRSGRQRAVGARLGWAGALILSAAAVGLLRLF